MLFGVLSALCVASASLVSAAPFESGAWVVERSGAAAQPVDRKLVDDFKYWSEWAAASYCPVQTSKTDVKVTCGTYNICPLLEKVDTKIINNWLALGYDKGYTAASGATGFVGVDNARKMVVLSLRGSVNIQNWITDVKFALQDCPEFGKGARCEVGFYNFWQESKPLAIQGIKKALAENPSYNIVVTGHSLGASAAVFAAADVRNLYKNKDVWLYSYGQPRAGNEVLSKYVTEQGKNFRVTHTSDIVPRLPWETSTAILGDADIYTHISPEYWITDGLGNNPEKYQVLEGMKNYEGNAAQSWAKVNLVAHIQYYQQNMYGCTLSFLPMSMSSSIGIGYPAGSKFVVSDDNFDVETTPQELAQRGVEGIFTKEWQNPDMLRSIQ